ncbi:hypothetical protein TKK_0001448 [Trichogramma kaykai]|uniref:Ubiquitin-like domain-containing protein n=1 Tax=Trichogramma kaykai TaxID=54128 RepID=A0ABD2X1W8_9HYME
MKVKVKMLMGEEHIFEILPTETILQVKEKIRDKLAIDVPQQSLLFMGKALTDENEVGFYPGIKDESKLILVKKAPQISTPKNGLHIFKTEILKVLKNYYTESDALTIANQTIKDLQMKVAHMSYDDLERLATALLQDQENNI